MKSRETETFSRPDIFGLTGTETSTETRKVSVPRVSAPRPPISGWGGESLVMAVHQAEEQGEVVLPMATRPQYSAILQEDWDPLDYVGRSE